MSDYIVRATAADGQIRAFAANTKDVVETARKDHNTSPVATAALGRLLTVLSELDSSRQNYLLQSIHNIQTVITCTGLDELIENNFSIDRVFRVTEGKIDF